MRLQSCGPEDGCHPRRHGWTLLEGDGSLCAGRARNTFQRSEASRWRMSRPVSRLPERFCSYEGVIRPVHPSMNRRMAFVEWFALTYLTYREVRA